MESFQLSLTDYSPQCLIKSVNKGNYLFFSFFRLPGFLYHLQATTQGLECICFSTYELWTQLAPLFMNYYWSACLHRIVSGTNAFSTVTSLNIVLLFSYIFVLWRMSCTGRTTKTKQLIFQVCFSLGKGKEYVYFNNTLCEIMNKYGVSEVHKTTMRNGGCRSTAVTEVHSFSLDRRSLQKM